MSIHTRREITWKEQRERWQQGDSVDAVLVSRKLVTSSEKRYKEILAKHPNAKARTLGFAVRWREGSKNCSRTFDLKSDAKAWDAKVRHVAQFGGVPILKRAGHPTLEEFFARWLASKHNLSRRTRDGYISLFKAHVLDEIGFVPLPNLTVERMDQWQTRRLAFGAGPVAVAKTSALLSQVFKRAMRLGYLSANPMDLLEKPRAEKSRKPPATVEQVERLRLWFLEEGRLADVALIGLMAYGTCRVGEALALHAEDFSQGRKLWICRSLEDDGTIKETKTGKEGLAILPEPAAEDLLTWRRESGVVSGLFFPHAKHRRGWKRDERNTWRRCWYSKAQEFAGIDLAPRDLRHVSASLRVAAGMRPTEVAEEMRHTFGVSVDVYQRLMREFEGQSIRPMDEVIREAREKVTSESQSGRMVTQENATATPARTSGGTSQGIEP
jgi:integrase